MIRKDGLLARFGDELTQAWAILVKDVRVYYLTPPMIMMGLLMPFFMFFSFSVQRGMAPQAGVARLLALTTFFTASSAGPVIIPLERRTRTYDRLLAAPTSLVTILVGKSLVGAFFGLAVSLVPLVAGLALFDVSIADPVLLIVSVILSAGVFSTLGILFASGSAQSPGQVLMPSTLLRWPLLFVSGIFIPLEEMAPWTRAISYLSPLTYAQDLLNHAVFRSGTQSQLLDLVVLFCLMVLFLLPALKLHDRSRRLGD
jgi:ABC-2 type transport system permease protein